MRLGISALKLLAVFLALPLIGGTGDAAYRIGSGADDINYGVVATSCSPDRAAAERHAGIRFVTLDVAWDQYEPQENQFATNYITDMRKKIGNCRNAGLKVILSVGLQYPPKWVYDLIGSSYTDQYGNLSAGRIVNLVFSEAVRQSVAAYLRRISTDLGLNNFAAVRVGTNKTGELGYPGDFDDTDQRVPSFWAFDQAAQEGDGLASGMSATPLPGWMPGMLEWRGQPVDSQQTAEWFHWYSRSLVAAISWQVSIYRSLGFTGDFHLPIAGRGALPKDLESALSNHLDGRGNPDGALERGLSYPDQFSLLADLDKGLGTGGSSARVIVDFAGLDDNTAVQARKANPPQDVCQPGDTDRLLTRTDTDRWASQRWTIANAALVGLPVVGENPGPPNSPDTGGSPDSDSEAQQVTMGISYARACHLGTFQLAFEKDLFDKNSPIGIDDYAREISGP